METEVVKLKKTYTPMGARLLVDEIASSLSIEERAERAGLIAVVEHDNRPRTTMGRVIAIGNDPILQESGVEVGDIVHHSPHAGYETFIEDHPFRMLEWQDITLLEKEVKELSPSPTPAPQTSHQLLESPTASRPSQWTPQEEAELDRLQKRCKEESLP